MTKAKQQAASESSTEREVQDANAASSSSADPANESAGGEERKDDLLSAIQDVIPEGDEETDQEDEDLLGSEPADGSSPSEDGAESESEAESEDAEDDEESEDESEKGESAEDKSDETDEDKDPPFHEHPRWKKLVAERDQLKEPAENYQRITEYMNSNGLTPEEVAEGFQIMALMRNDPATAKRVLDQKIQGLQQFDPGYVPQDIQQDIDSGAISPERGQELAQLRAREHQAQYKTERLGQQNEQLQTQRQQDQQRVQATERANAVNAWEQEIQQKDPDYARKAPFVRDRIVSLMREKGQPATPDDAVKMARTAYDDINKQVAEFRPKQRKQQRKVTPSGGGASSEKTEPDSLEGAIRAAVGKG